MSELRYCCIIPKDSRCIQNESNVNARGTCPLQNVAVSGLIRDAVAQYTLVQTYVNPRKDAAIEAVYTFPLYEGVAVCGFEAEVDGRKIVGRVQEKAAARKEYESAKKAGKVASLLDEETPEVFQASVGNIPPSKTVAIRLTLISELKQDAEENQVRFVMPTTIAPRYGDYPDVMINAPSIDTSNSSKPLLAVTVGCAMSKAITSIQSPSHTIQVHLGTTSGDASSGQHSFEPNRARVTLTADSLLDRDLVIIVQALGLDEPHALVERHPKDGTHAISLTLSPRFALNPIRSLELIFIVDRSGSMDEGNRIKQAGAALELFLRSIPCEDHYINVIGFGSEHEALFPKSVPYNADSLKRSTRYAQTMEANMGGTEMLSAFQEAFERQRFDVPTQIFLLTDGEIWDVDSLCEIVREAVEKGEGGKSYVRVFSLGIGDDVSHSLIESVARAGDGYAQLVMGGERMEKKVLNMLKAALVPPVTNTGVHWTSEFETDRSEDSQVEEFVLVEAEEFPPAQEEASPAESDATNKTPIDLFSTLPEVPSLPPPPPARPPPAVVIPIHQAPFKIPILCRGARFTMHAILSPTVPVPEELVLQGSSPDGLVELKVKIETVQEGETMLHSLAARAIVRDLEEGSSCVHALGMSPTATQKETLKRLGIHVVTSEGKKYTNAALSSKHVAEIAKELILDIAMRYNLSSKHTSWVAIDDDTRQCITYDKLEPGEEWCYEKTMCADYSDNTISAKPAYCYSLVDEIPSEMPKSEPPIAEGRCESVEMAAPADLKFFASDVASDADNEDIRRCLARDNETDSKVLEVIANVDSCEELEGESPEEPISATDPHSRLRSLLQHQSFDGSFPLAPEIAAFFATTVEALNGKLAEVRKQCALSTTLSESEWGTIWATCLAVEFMTQQLPELQDEWELVVDKAEKRVEALLRNAQDIAAAIKLVAAAVVAAASSDEHQCADNIVRDAANTPATVGSDSLETGETVDVVGGDDQSVKEAVITTLCTKSTSYTN